jgi:hypothetical protein
LRAIYTKHNFCVAPSRTTASNQIRISRNCVRCCRTTRCDTSIRFHVTFNVHIFTKIRDNVC